jgi:AcrR family transcriptional regulator
MELARTLDTQAHAVRRDAFVDAAQQLVATKGYERMSIQDVLDALGTSKGAFYHYFDSKAALLDAIVERMTDEAVARVAPALADPGRSALEKFEAFFGGIGAYKAERRDLVLATFRSWLADQNAIVREHFRRGLVARLEPLMAAIVRQGVAEGAFRVSAPDATARVLVSMIQGMNEDTLLFSALIAGTLSIEHVEYRLVAYREAFERILGAPAGSLGIGDPALLRQWHQWLTENEDRA